MIKPAALKPGDLVGLVAPAGPFSEERFRKGCAILEGMGFRIFCDESIFERSGYFAGATDRRLAELHRMFGDPQVRAVWCVRGGYGSMRLLGGLDYDLVRASRKLFIGFSDATAIHCAFNRICDLVTIHGPMVCSIVKEGPEVVSAVRGLIMEGRPAGLLEARGRPVVAGVARGRLIGGNLSVLSTLLGTRFEPDTSGCVLLLEDLDERPYRLDRMMTHLRLAGKLDRLRGIVFGEILRCDDPEETTYGGEPLRLWGREVVEEILKELGLPAVMDFPAGHGKINFPLPLGCEVTLNAAEGTLSVEEPAVA